MNLRKLAAPQHKSKLFCIRFAQSLHRELNVELIKGISDEDQEHNYSVLEPRGFEF